MMNSSDLKNTDLLRKGEAQAEYNSNLTTIMRIDDLKRKIDNEVPLIVDSFDGIKLWLRFVHSLDKEVSPLLNEAEEKDLSLYRIKELINIRNPSSSILSRLRLRVNNYERRVRHYIQIKGLGVTAKISSDPGRAILE